MDHSAEASTHTAEVYMQPGDQQPPRQLGQTTASWTRHTKLGAVQVIPDWGPEDVQVRQERAPHLRWKGGVALPAE